MAPLFDSAATLKYSTGTTLHVQPTKQTFKVMFDTSESHKLHLPADLLLLLFKATCNAYHNYLCLLG